VRPLIAAFAYLLYLTLGTYAVPAMRVGVGTWVVPYAVPLAAMLAVLGLFAFLARGGGQTKTERMLTIWISLYLGATVLSLPAALVVDPELATKTLLMASFPLVLTLSRPGEALCRRCIWLLGMSSLAVALYGVYGYVTGSIGTPSQHAYGYLGVTYTDSTRNGDSLYFQTFLWVALGAATSYRKRTWLRVILFAGALGAVVAVILTLSRGAWVAVALTPAVVLVGTWNSWRGRMRSVVLVAICLGAAAAISMSFSETARELVSLRVNTLTTMSRLGGNSNTSRVNIITAVLPIIAQHPLLGVGYGNLRYYFPQNLGMNINHAENAYLQAFAEQGVVGFIAFAGLLAWTIKKLLRLVSASGRRQDWAAMVLLAMVVDFAVFSLFNNVLDNMWFWSVMALAALYVCSSRPATMAPRRVSLRGVAAGRARRSPSRLNQVPVS